MGDTRGASSGWTWEENKKFEKALATMDEKSPDLWKEMALVLGGAKTAEEVEKHYHQLEADILLIESGVLDDQVDKLMQTNHYRPLLMLNDILRDDKEQIMHLGDAPETEEDATERAKKKHNRKVAKGSKETQDESEKRDNLPDYAEGLGIKLQKKLLGGVNEK